MAKILILDCDGVIIPTQHSINKIKTIAAKMNLTFPPEDFIKIHWGKRWEEDLLFIFQEYGKWSDEARIAFMHDCRQNSDLKKAAFHDLKELIIKLSQQYILAIITNREECTLTPELEGMGIPLKLFTYIQSCDNSKFFKPHPETLLPLGKELHKGNVNVEKILYVGDMIGTDLQLVHNYNRVLPNHGNFRAFFNNRKMDFIGVTYMHDAKEFRAAGVKSKMIINSIHELPQALKACNF